MIAGLACLPLALLVLLSLVSYDWTDIASLSTPPNRPPNNWIGQVGAYIGYLLWMTAGVGAWLVPVWLSITGLRIALQRGPVRAKSLWAAGCMALFAALLDLHGLVDIQTVRNITHNGGIVGWLVTHSLLIRWLSTMGAGALLWSGFLFTFVMAVGWHNLRRAFRYTVVGFDLLIDYLANRRSEMRDRHTELEQEERMLRKKQVRLERELRRKDLAEQLKQRVDQMDEDPPDVEPDVAGKRKVRSVLRNATELLRPAPKSPEPPVPDDDEEAQEALAVVLPAPVIDPEKARFPGYQLPPISLLDPVPESHNKNSGADNSIIAAKLVQTLGEFGIEAEVTSIKQGPVVTRYELLPARGVRVERIAALANNLALSLKAHSLRVQAPVPGKGVVGIEVPNEVANMVVMRELIESEEWNAGTVRLPLALGKDVGGRNVVADLAKMPHLLVAGATGSGKSVCINAVLAGLFMSKSPDELRLLLVDPKIVEFSIYNDLPHLVVPVITDPKKVSMSLRWAITEMENRYKMFAKVKVRNIEGFNNRHAIAQGELFGDETPAEPKVDEFPPSVPYIVIVIDELADLMLAAGAEIENSIARLAQLSRAVGIHMIIATQRPSVNVITGTIKANFPARIAFQVAQKVDSRTILDQSGADKLLGRGDMLFLPPATSKLVRAQGAMITDQEIERIIQHIKAQAAPSFESEIHSKLDKVSSSSGGESMDGGEDDELVEQAIEIIRETHRASTSSLQRRMRIGYTRAARIIDILEERGMLGPPRGAE
ncbi:MAG TPA: cell division protein FtsK, partial [Verrucomicrobia bacterium]|nr:cell division protein FtsK [Verrucomicrobiota bacterium]